MYKNYLFDLYGTLLEIETNEETDYVWEKMALYYGYCGSYYEPFELKDKYGKNVKKMVNDYGEGADIDIQDVFYKLFRDSEIKPKKKAPKEAAKMFRILTTEKLALYEGVIDMLMALKNQKKNVYIVANAQSAFALLELKNCSIRKYFDDFYFSSDLHIKKPDITFYEKVFQEERLNKKESIIISADYDNDIVLAQQIGVDALFIDTSEKTELKENIDEEASAKDKEVKSDKIKKQVKTIMAIKEEETKAKLYTVKGYDFRKIIDNIVK